MIIYLQITIQFTGDIDRLDCLLMQSSLERVLNILWILLELKSYTECNISIWMIQSTLNTYNISNLFHHFYISLKFIYLYVDIVNCILQLTDIDLSVA